MSVNVNHLFVDMSISFCNKTKYLEIFMCVLSFCLVIHAFLSFIL